MHNVRIDALIDSWKDELIGNLQKWLSVPSVLAESAGEGKPFGEETAKMLELALDTARNMGFEAEGFDGYAGHVQMGSGEQTMGILAHLDVVPTGDGWKHDPFGGEIEDGKIFGRGACDDKGPALAALYAMRAVREAGVKLKHGVRLILGCDEETGMLDMRHYAGCCQMPDYGFSPDAEYPVINTEKGGLSITLNGLGGNEESAKIPVYSLYAGERVNVVPGVAWAEVGTENVSIEEMRQALLPLDMKITLSDMGNGRARVEAEGRSAHASMPHAGVNAAGMLLIALAHLQAGGNSQAAIAALAEKIGLEGDGKSLGIAVDDELCGPLTCNLGLLRYDGLRLTAQLDIRFPLATSHEKVCGQMALALVDTPLLLKYNGGGKVHHVPAEHPVVQGLLRAYHETTGQPAYAFAIGGGTYSRMMPNTVAFGCNFPGDVDCAHMPDEYVELDKYLLTVKIMARAIEELAGE